MTAGADTSVRPPRISVILPVWNREWIVLASVQSVLGQTFRDLELIIIDDGSTDGTIRRLATLDDPRVRVIACPTNRGAAAARNVGISEARGPLIAFQDSDDLWIETHLESLVQRFDASGPRVGLTYCVKVVRHGDRTWQTPAKNQEPPQGNVLSDLLRENFISTPAALVRRSCLEHVGGFDESLPSLEDWELWIRVAKSYDVAFAAETRVLGTRSANSISNNLAADREARKEIYVKHWVAFASSHSGGFRTRLQHLARAYLRGGSRRDAWRALRWSARFGVTPMTVVTALFLLAPEKVFERARDLRSRWRRTDTLT